MRPFLLSPGQDVDLEQDLCAFFADLHADLGLEGIFQSMAANDDFLDDVARKVLLSATENDVETVLYRQEILKDCLKNRAAVAEIYALCVDTIERERKNFFSVFVRSPGSVLHRSVQVLEMFSQRLKALRTLTQSHVDDFASAGFLRLFADLKQELGDEYFAEIAANLKTLRFRDGVLVSVAMGAAGKGKDYILRAPRQSGRHWLAQIFTHQAPHFTLTLHPRDEAGARALDGLRDRGLNSAANALAQSSDHILSFFKTLRAELAFYLGCVNLHEALGSLTVPRCFPIPSPVPLAPDQMRWQCQALCDAALALGRNGPVTGNSIDADGRKLVLVTGANRGGKSTFLRSAGLAQLMMRAGMFVAAESFSASLSAGLFTHFKREEDHDMVSGKFDEELARMNRLADVITPGALILFNESFAATNEGEGSEVARQIVQALGENHVRVFFVTHMFTFADGFHRASSEQTLCLRAERASDGSRSFRLKVAPPLATSYGADLFRQIWHPET